ncbi:hypothetical protein BX616_010534 [Lobosporangium transversale]|uniref:Uncharacterized protein n=1 Tax=Lobosporangium transversale TaxID=64571 RepID=A0A1Y2GVQ7_9FUNG|nr:hypothetical protein BCR41DRAFT_384449 [Lobosporangium transversale]KAF9911620.1 hypothetical protein BX616_010534 [Lobosporangium transversale]ORZ26345.1 hypothetical protein BCR41DRAFT_384449 [Lobosporangium transversale]|eukprot:XP_021884110.1 hypothetical protein BCR41DRAFT_384449 [Lobosporangium transversale]
MIPAKRSSPFARARSFPNSQAQRESGNNGTDGTPLSKRLSFARTMSTPFQVLHPSLKATKNPFEKLASATPSPREALDPLITGRSTICDTEQEGEDDALDPNRTLSLFSFSQSTTGNSGNQGNDPGDSEDDSPQEEPDQEFLDPAGDSRSELDVHKLSLQPKPRLHEALAKANIQKGLQADQELKAPSVSSNSSKKMGSGFTTSTIAPLDWTLKTSLSITSQDPLTWCDHGAATDEIQAMQLFVSLPSSFSFNQGPNVKYNPSTSARIRLLAASYHWIYPTNTPTILQAQSISKILKNIGNMASSEKASITELFSRSTEWKQAFKTLYQSCRNGTCLCFYYVGTTWAILFQHGSVSLSGDIEAILTNSTPGLRKVLEDEEIKFERLPNVARKTTIHHFSAKHDLDDSSDNEEDRTNRFNVAKAPLVQPGSHNLSDTLLFKGQVDVHGLFSHLLNMKTTYEDGFLYQSPMLIADVPFLHAGLKRAINSKCRIVSKHVEGTDRVQKEYRVDIQGLLLPTATREIYSIFAQEQPTGFNSFTSSDARSLGLNLRPLLLKEKPQEKGIFVGDKSMDQLRYDSAVKQFAWLM